MSRRTRERRSPDRTSRCWLAWRIQRGHLDATIDAWERLYRASAQADDRLAAAGAAVRIAMHLLFDTALLAPVRAWLARAERLLEGLDDTPVHAWFAVVDIEDARATGDVQRAAQADAEREFLVRELARAVGLGGRDRRAGSASERAGSAVTRASRHGLARIREHRGIECRFVAFSGWVKPGTLGYVFILSQAVVSLSPSCSTSG